MPNIKAKSATMTPAINPNRSSNIKTMPMNSSRKSAIKPTNKDVNLSNNALANPKSLQRDG